MKNDLTHDRPAIHDCGRAPRTRDKIARREFIKRAGYTGAGLALAFFKQGLSAKSASPELPKRLLGRTGQKVSILGLGTAPVGEGPVGLQEGIKIFGEAIDRGVTYIDTARIYGNAEEILGHLVPKRRDRLFIATKVSTHTAEGAERSLGESLRRLKIDHVDLVHIHSIGSKNLDRVLGKGGALEYLLKQKELGKTRFIGISGHNRPPNFLHMVETDQIDVLMCVMNYADRNIYDFEGKVLSEAKKRNVGCAAMKVYAGIKGGFPNHRHGYVGCATEPARLPQALAYALDLDGVAVAVVGPYTVEQAAKNVEFALKYQPLSREKHASLMEYGKKLASSLGPRYGPIT
jgi:predicted aldo/keto reductase-like oxidoreductase